MSNSRDGSPTGMTGIVERINAGRYMFGSANIKFKPGTDRDIIWRAKRCIDLVTVPPAKRPAPPPGTQIAASQCLIENMKQKINPELLKVSVECPAWKKGHVKAVGRFCGALRSMQHVCADWYRGHHCAR
eukprot:908778-Pyramimonas_sp.AAC.1